MPPYDISIGRSVRVDIGELIHEVYISPFSTKEYREEIKSPLKKNRIWNIVLKESVISGVVQFTAQ